MKAETLYKLTVVTGASVFPDGDGVVYAVSRVDRKSEKKICNLFMYRVGEESSRQLTYSDASDVNPRISPDGKSLAFLSDRKTAGQFQLYVMPVDGGEAQCLTEIEGAIFSQEWSPNSKQIAFLHRPSFKKETKPEHGTVAHFVEANTFYKLDGVGYFPETVVNLKLLTVRSGKLQALTREKVHSVASFGWHPDGKHLFFSRRGDDRPDAHPSANAIKKVSLKTRRVTDCGLRHGAFWCPVLSPDGKQVAVLGSKHLDYWQRNAEVLVFSEKTGRIVSRTSSFDFNMTDMTLGDCVSFSNAVPAWSSDGKSIFGLCCRHGTNTIVRFSAGGKQQVDTIAEHDGAITWFHYHEGTGRVWAHVSSQETPSAIVLKDIDSDSWKSVTRLNATVVKGKNLGRVEEVWLPARGNTPALQGWIYYPKNFNPRKKYPAIIQIHGGPQCQYGKGFFHEFRYLNEAGYVVACCNPRGSQGYGEAFCRAINGAWGSVDYDDVMRFSKFISKKSFVKALGVTGGSYGGYMTNWIIGHTNLFKAAVTQRSISNWISFYGSCDFNWQTEFLLGEDTKPWRNLDHYWDLSPLKYVARVKTPTLVIHSDQDLRCPLEQGEQFFVALKREGVPARLVVFPGESHGLSRAGRTDRRILRLKEIRQWFDRYLK